MQGKKQKKNTQVHHNLRAGLLLLLLPQSEEGDTGDLDDLETDTGQITDAVVVKIKGPRSKYYALENLYFTFLMNITPLTRGRNDRNRQ